MPAIFRGYTTNCSAISLRIPSIRQILYCSIQPMAREICGRQLSLDRVIRPSESRRFASMTLSTIASEGNNTTSTTIFAIAAVSIGRADVLQPRALQQIQPSTPNKSQINMWARHIVQKNERLSSLKMLGERQEPLS